MAKHRHRWKPIPPDERDRIRCFVGLYRWTRSMLGGLTHNCEKIAVVHCYCQAAKCSRHKNKPFWIHGSCCAKTVRCQRRKPRR